MDGTDEVAKKKSKKGKDKDSSKLEKALKVSPQLCERRPLTLLTETSAHSCAWLLVTHMAPFPACFPCS